MSRIINSKSRSSTWRETIRQQNAEIHAQPDYRAWMKANQKSNLEEK